MEVNVQGYFSRNSMRNMANLNQKLLVCIFLSQNAGLSVRHLHTYHQSLNFYTFWRNPHLLVCSRPEMVFFLPLWAIRILCLFSFAGFIEPCGMKEGVRFKMSKTRVTGCVCLVLAIGAISLKDQAFFQCLH